MTWEAPGTFLLPSTLPKFTFSCSLWGVGFFWKAGEWPKASGEGTKPSLHGWLRVDINFPGPPSSSQASALKIPGRAWRRSSDSRLLFFALTSEATTTLYTALAWLKAALLVAKTIVFPRGALRHCIQNWSTYRVRFFFFRLPTHYLGGRNELHAQFWNSKSLSNSIILWAKRDKFIS